MPEINMFVSPFICDRYQSPLIENKKAPTIIQISLNLPHLPNQANKMIKIPAPADPDLKKNPKPFNARIAKTVGINKRKYIVIMDVLSFMHLFYSKIIITRF